MTSAGAADSERAAIRAYLLGADNESAKHWEEAARAAVTAGDHAEGARYAFWLGLCLMMRCLEAPASGWFSRAEELSTAAGRECPASGYVLIPRMLAALTDDPQGASDMAVRATEIGVRCGDADLCALGTLASRHDGTATNSRRGSAFPHQVSHGPARHHSATIAQRRPDDHGVEVSESTVRRYIAATFTEQRLEEKVTVPRGCAAQRSPDRQRQARDVARPRHGPPGGGVGEFSDSAQ